MKVDIWKEKFSKPSSKYYAKPFWSWNGKLDEKLLCKQIEVFSEMGYGGFHIHSRVGLADPYLGERFLKCVNTVHEYAKKKGMETWLYDEDKWPSGFSGGLATHTESTKAKCLLLSHVKYPEGYHITGRKQPSRLTENGSIHLLAAYRVELNNEGFLTGYKRLTEDISEANWYAYRLVTDSSTWFNNESYGDLLNPETTKSIIRVTHETYQKVVGSDFGKSIPCIFTDEPQHCMTHTLKKALGIEEPSLPYTDQMDALFQEKYGYSFLDKLPEIFWNDKTLVSKVRWQYQDWITEQFRTAYFCVLQQWCEKNGIMLTGHVMREETLNSQTQCVGEAMRLYDAFDIPGLDILANRHEYSTAKQVQSVAHQDGKKGVMCEMFGVTNWDFSFCEQKGQLDWLVALGTTVRVPHLAWMQMGGESKRDYPAALDFHSPWYTRYRVMENYAARITEAMDQGKPVVRTAILHPIESFWCIYGPEDQTIVERTRLEKQFSQLIEWLLFGNIDFDFIAESLLTEQQIQFGKDCIQVGSMVYEAIVVPPLLTIRKNTLEILKRFVECGGKIIQINELPEFIEAEYCGRIEIAETCKIGFDFYALMDALEEQRDVLITDKSGIQTNHFLYQLRRDTGDSWLFIAKGRSVDQSAKLSYFAGDGEGVSIRIGVRGIYDPEICNAFNGTMEPCNVTYHDGWTFVNIQWFENDSILLHLGHNRQIRHFPKISLTYEKPIYFDHIEGFKLQEENVLVLDMPEYKLDDGNWCKNEEILRLDNTIREKVGYPKRTDSFLQPWITKGDNPLEHVVVLRYKIWSECELLNVKLGYESDCNICWNGEYIRQECIGNFIDTAIRKIEISYVKKGWNVLELSIPFGPRTNLEACYLLGEFGVKCVGSEAFLTDFPRKIGFGDLTFQGFPFYGGTIEYELDWECKEEGDYDLTVPNFAGALVDIGFDNRELCAIICEPFCARIEKVSIGIHKIKLICYGNRVNTFGQLHNCCRGPIYYGPNSWRSLGSNWSYTYQLHPTGILSSVYLKRCILKMDVSG